MGDLFLFAQTDLVRNNLPVVAGGRITAHPRWSRVRRKWVQPEVSSNCLESQWEWVKDLVAGWFQDEPYLSMELRIISSLRMQAVRASFFGLPADNRRW